MEPRLSIYGREKDEWDKLASWAITHDVTKFYLKNHKKNIIKKCIHTLEIFKQLSLI